MFLTAFCAAIAFTIAGESIAIEKTKAGVGPAAQDNVTVLLRDGRIVAIGRDVAIPPGSERIDGSGLTLLPGFIDGFGDFGLQKIEGERPAPLPGNEGLAQDYGIAAYAETAEASRRGLKPEVRARDLLAAPDREAQEKLRLAGFTSLVTAPTEGLIPGQACLLELAELPPRDGVVGDPNLLVARFRGERPAFGGGPPAQRGRREEGDSGYPQTLMGSLAHLRQAFLDAQRLRSWRESWRRNPAQVPRPPSDSCLDTLLRALDGELRVAFVVDREGDVLRALAFAEEFRLKAAIVGGKEAWKVAGRIAAARVPVIASLNFPDAPERRGAKWVVKKRGDAPAEAPKGASQVIAEGAAGDAPGEASKDASPVIPLEVGKVDAPLVAGPSKPVEKDGEWEVADPVLAEPLELFEERKHDWEDEVRNVERLLAAGVQVALTTRGSSGTSDFLGDLRVAIEHGLNAESALAALTSTPAALFGVEGELGAVRVGAAADLVLVEGDLASKERSVRHVFVGGKHYRAPKKGEEKPASATAAGGESARPGGREGRRRGEWNRNREEPASAPDAGSALDVSGAWTLAGSGGKGFTATLTLKQDAGKLTGTLESEHGKADVTSGTLEDDRFKIQVTFALQERSFDFKLEGSATKDLLKGRLETPFGEPSDFEAKRVGAPDTTLATAPKRDPSRNDGGTPADFVTEADRKPALHTGGTFFLKGATLLTVSHGTIENGDLLVKDGRIAAIGPGLTPPEGVTVIDGAGLFVMPGLIDCHSHAAIEGGVNEGTLSIVPEVRIRDEVDPKDRTIWLALAGGTTTMNLLHGSANVIGGQNAVVKMRYGRPAADMLFEGAPRGVKFALGENPKQSNFGGGGFDRARRFPATRMGVEAALRRAFTRANDYREEWKEYAAAKSRGEERLEPRRDQRLEALVDIMEGRILVHSHCYRADEILMLMRVAEDFGFRIRTLQHVLEGYKVADEIARHGAGPSTFSDWWAYKLEAYDAVPYNAALLALAGTRCSLNSDSADLTRRLYHEAAKTLRYGNVDEQEALAQVTLNPAWQLGIDARVGSLDVGKDADLAVFNGHPLSVYSRCELTFVDGECYFERRYAEGEARPLNPTGPRFGPVACSDPSQLPVAGNGGIYALVGATLHPVNAPSIENGVLVIERGRIAALGADLPVPANAEVVRCDGLHVYPGLFDAATSLGLGEIGSVAGGQDTNELGDVQPDLRVTAAIHPASSHFAVTRCDGVTTAMVLPAGGTIAGRGSLLQLDGSTWEEMVVADSNVLRLRFPDVANDETPEKALEKEPVAQLERLFDAALRYDDARAAAPRGVPTAPAYEALVPFLREVGTTPAKLVLIDANDANQLRAAALFAEKRHLNALLLGCSEAWLVTDYLKEKGARCLVAGSLGMPRGSQRYDAAYQNAARLFAAGVPFAIVSMEQENVRQLGHHAGMASAFGLPPDAALRAVTLSPAELLGVQDRYGSLEPGKVASVIVTDGDPLELRTHVLAEFIGGRPVPLVSKQTELYEAAKKRLLEKKSQATGTTTSAASAGGGG
jgi:imidazolonepropionase-like amidohydrolase